MRRLKCFLLMLVILLSTAGIAYAKNDGYSGDIDISDYLDDFEEEKISLKTPPISELTTVAENKNLKLNFDEKGMDLYITGASGRIWSNVITDEFYPQKSPVPRISSQLLTVTASDYSDTVHEYTLYDGSNRDITAKADIQDNKLILNVEISAVGISFKVEFGIRENGFYYVIPDGSIEENGGKLVSISMLHNFGASRIGEDGYLFYPDGCGAIMRFDKKNGASDTLQQYSVYGSSDITFVQLERNWSDQIYGALLPVWGVSKQHDGFLGIIEDGAADSRINISMPGYQIPEIYRSYLSYHYRTHSSMTLNDTNYSALSDKRSKANHGCYFELLSDNDNDYSGMARCYRQYLTDAGILTKRKAAENMSLSLNLLCGVQKNGIFGSSFCKMTSYSEAQKIAEYFSESGVKNLDIVLSGWSKGGWDVVPTKAEAEGKLGGKSGLKNLNSYLKKSGGTFSLDIETILADSSTGSFNMRKDAARNYFGQFYCDKTKTRYILNADHVLKPMLKKFSNSFGNMGMNLLTVGKLVYPNYSKNNFVSSQSVVDSYSQIMKQAKKQGICVSASTGNSYVLPYVDRIYSLPQNDSGHTFTTQKVPFYQMVIHGYIPYTGAVGNTHYDYEKCILEWVENGCIPSYILTWKNTGKLLDSKYDEVFSSEFSVWKEKIQSTYRRFEQDFSDLQTKTIDRHENLWDGMVRLTYSDGTNVYVNYNESDAKVDGKIVGGKDYLIVGE